MKLNSYTVEKTHASGLPLKKIQLHNPALEKSQKDVKSPPAKKMRIKIANPWQSQTMRSGNERDLVIGFDLGTSSTKIVIQDRQLRKAFAVPFDKFCSAGNRYLLPTILYCDPYSNISLKSGTMKIDNIKVNFMKDPKSRSGLYGFDATNQDLIIAYVALVLMKICKWFWEKKSSDYADNKINWELNIGIPAKTWDDTRLSEAMKKAALAGWNLSLTPKQSISIKDIGIALNEANEQIGKDDCDENRGQLHPDLIKPVPELVAEVMGFAQSQLRRDGMYLLTDIGATTLDISTFILHENQEEENIFTILSSDVQPLGAHNLHRNRINSSISIYKNKLGNQLNSYDGISALPDVSQYQPAIDGVDKKKLLHDDECYLNDCSKVLRKVVGETKKKRNPHSPAWASGVPSFLCGGGSQVDLYKKLIPCSGRKLLAAGIHGFEVKKLPKPDNLENDDILPQEYHRIAVSYGLSFSVDNMGKIIPAREVEDLTYDPPEVNIANRYIDKDMV